MPTSDYPDSYYAATANRLPPFPELLEPHAVSVNEVTNTSAILMPGT